MSASQQKFAPADGITNDAQLLGPPRYLTTGQKSDLVLAKEGRTLASDSDPLLRPEGLAKEGTTLASDSDPLLRPEGLDKDGTTLASDSDPLLRPGIHRTSAYGSSSTGAVGAN